MMENPKTEIRRPKEIRNPNCTTDAAARLFRFRPSDLRRLSAFGFRISLLASLLSGLAPAAAQPVPEHRAKQIFEAAPVKARVTPAKPRRVLVFNTPAHLMDKDPHKGYCIPYGAVAFDAIGKKTGAYEAVVSDDLAMFLSANLRQFDAIVLNNTSGRWITPTAADLERPEFKGLGADTNAVEQVLRRNLLAYFSGAAGGGGLVGIHFAVGANPHWPEFQEMLGARYSGHPWNEEVGIRVDEPSHPLAAAFGGKNFRVADEIYQFRDPYSRQQLRVLLSLNTNESNMGVKWIERKDGDFGLGWVKPYDNGRVFYTALGHRTEIYWNPAVLAFFLDGVQFATGDLPASVAPSAIVADESETGFTSIFNGKDLTGWEGDPRYWSARDGTITGQTTTTLGVTENNFLIWQGGQPRDFELRCKFKLIGGNSGIYFHAEKRAPGAKGEALVGPQADFSADHKWTGTLMEYTKRDILASRGRRTIIDERGGRNVFGMVGHPDELLKAVKGRDWNDYRVIARGEWVVLQINGVTMCEVLDKDPRRTPAGHLAVQVHVGPPMQVQFKDIRIRQF